MVFVNKSRATVQIEKLKNDHSAMTAVENQNCYDQSIIDSTRLTTYEFHIQVRLKCIDKHRQNLVFPPLM